MSAKINKFSYISKLLSFKSKLGGDFLSLPCELRVTGYFLWVEVALSQYSEYSEHEEGNIIDASQVCPKDFNL